MPGTIEYRVSEDRRLAEMLIPSDPPALFSFDAAALDRHIDAVVKLRTDVIPPPSVADVQPGEKVDVIRDPRYWTQRDPLTGGTVLRLHHPALGWVSFLLPAAERDKLLGFLQRQAEEERRDAEPSARH